MRLPTFGTAVRDPFQSEIFHHTIRTAWCNVRLYAAHKTKRAVNTVSKPKHRKVVDRMASSAACKLASTTSKARANADGPASPVDKIDPN